MLYTYVPATNPPRRAPSAQFGRSFFVGPGTIGLTHSLASRYLELACWSRDGQLLDRPVVCCIVTSSRARQSVISKWKGVQLPRAGSCHSTDCGQTIRLPINSVVELRRGRDLMRGRPEDPLTGRSRLHAHHCSWTRHQDWLSTHHASAKITLTRLQKLLHRSCLHMHTFHELTKYASIDQASSRSMHNPQTHLWPLQGIHLLE